MTARLWFVAADGTIELCSPRDWPEYHAAHAAAHERGLWLYAEYSPVRHYRIDPAKLAFFRRQNPPR